MVPWQAAAAARGLRAVASLPIRFQGEVWGALTIYDSDPNVFQDKEIALLEEVAAAISFAFENLDRELQRRAGRRGPKAGTSHAETPSAIQRPRTADHRLRNS